MIVSKIVSDAVQSDGRRAITEKHTDDRGVVQFVNYVCDRDFDAEQALQDRKVTIEDELLKEDLEKATKTLVLPDRASPLDFILRIADLYKVAEGFEVARLATFLVTIDVSDLQLNYEKIQGEAALYEQVQSLRGA